MPIFLKKPKSGQTNQNKMVLSIVGSLTHPELQELWPVVKKGDYAFCGAYGISYEGSVGTG